MKKKIFVVLVLFVVLLTAGCTKNNEDALKFKEEYESINGQVNNNGQEHRTISISEDNPFVYATGDEIVEMVNNKETFYVYFGDKQCPWCRSVIEKAIEVANENNIDKIYYVSIWDGDHEEIFRDKYEYNSETDKVEKTIDGTKAYETLIDKFSNVLDDYVVSYTNKKGKEKTYNIGEKRIFAPDFIYVENGEAKSITTGISDKQTDSREELTEEILSDEEDAFNEFFKK